LAIVGFGRRTATPMLDQSTMIHEHFVRTQTYGYFSIVICHDTVKGPSLVSGKSVLREFDMIRMLGGTEAREDDRNSPAYWLRTVKCSFRRHKKPLNRISRPGPLSCSPRGNSRTEKKDLGCGALGEYSSVVSRYSKFFRTLGCFNTILSLVFS
jgi:hypothetical protein